ncbi:prenyltransferase/squalene oxidase repeat-containing protein [Streptomyces sp. NPDC040750]|uniref:prenyltransferase/squalene oxidase repeat-containing protein n=1 Tax=Streptomyces sp. NPDC040750 TaxID=3154491 RepID=UPI0033F075C0
MRIAPLQAGLPRWPIDAFPAGLVPGAARLRSHLLGRIDPDGALREPCRSRVLESALTVVLLDRTGLQPASRDRLAAYLAPHRDGPDVLDRLLARAALGERFAVNGLLDIEHLLRRAPGFAGLRKRAFMDAVLFLLGATSTAEFPITEAFSPHGLHPWAHVQVTSVKVILAHAAGKPRHIQKRDLELLRTTQRAGTVWEGNLLVHLSVLHALATLPGHDRLITEGIHTALEHQRADGGMPFICDEDTWCTATAGVALHVAAAPTPTLHAIAGRLARLQHPDGGWSFTDRAQLADVDCTSVGLELLHLVGPDTYRGPIRSALHALHALRGPDGGFPTYVAGAPSEACMTAAAVNALSTQGHAQRVAVDTALRYLAAQQYPDGSFPPDWSSSRLHTVFRAVLAAARLSGESDGPVQRMARQAVHLVVSTQNSDGGWGQQDGTLSDALSTAYALIALLGQSEPRPAIRGVAYLLTQQRADGSISSVPDSIGPRPFGFTVPVLADVFALLALGHLIRRCQPSPTVERNHRAQPHAPHLHGPDHAHHGPDLAVGAPNSRISPSSGRHSPTPHRTTRPPHPSPAQAAPPDSLPPRPGTQGPLGPQPSPRPASPDTGTADRPR